jgi:hypothetical protein
VRLAVIEVSASLQYSFLYPTRYMENSRLFGADDTISTTGGVNVFVRDYNICRMIPTVLHMSEFLIWIGCSAMKFYCDTLLDGGGWALVRRVKQGSEWHPATDNLAGTHAAYGRYGGPTFDETFGRPYSTWVTGSTEFLFMTGAPTDSTVMVH